MPLRSYRIGRPMKRYGVGLAKFRRVKYARYARGGLYGAAALLAAGAVRRRYRAIGRARGRKRYTRRSSASEKRSSQVASAYDPGNSTANASQWNTLHSQELLLMDRGTGIRERLSGRVFVKGFKICARIENTQTHDIEFHWAIIQKKYDADTSLNDNYFRGS